MKIAVLASHEGTTLQAILDACASGTIPGRVVAVLSNNAGSGALRRAAAGGVTALHRSSRTHDDPDALDAEIARLLAESGAEVVVLAGYMKKIGPRTLSRFAGRILNTHPALLPKFGGHGMFGMHVHRAVLAAGERTSGASVHVVDAEYDTGPVLAQTAVEVRADDTPESLAERVQVSERELLVETLSAIAAGQIALPAAPSGPADRA